MTGIAALRSKWAAGQTRRGQGVSTADYIPNLAELPPGVIYKELTDYRTGKRTYVVMNAVATGLSDQIWRM
jgi:cytochrome c553